MTGVTETDAGPVAGVVGSVEGPVKGDVTAYTYITYHPSCQYYLAGYISAVSHWCLYEAILLAILGIDAAIHTVVLCLFYAVGQ